MSLTKKLFIQTMFLRKNAYVAPQSAQVTFYRCFPRRCFRKQGIACRRCWLPQAPQVRRNAVMFPSLSTFVRCPASRKRCRRCTPWEKEIRCTRRCCRQVLREKRVWQLSFVQLLVFACNVLPPNSVAVYCKFNDKQFVFKLYACGQETVVGVFYFAVLCQGVTEFAAKCVARVQIHVGAICRAYSFVAKFARAPVGFFQYHLQLH